MKKVFLALIITLLLSATYQLQPTFARTTPEDILNDRRQSYNAQFSKYSPDNQKKLAAFEQKVANLNKQQTDELEQRMVRQGEILNEYVFRKGISERQADGISRNLSDPIENARYWLTYAHEAVAYQAAKTYIFNLSGESAIKSSITAQISQLQSDINILSGKVDKSQKIIETIVTKK